MSAFCSKFFASQNESRRASLDVDSGWEALYGHRVEFDFSCLFSGNCDEFNSLNTSCGVKGRLSAAVDFWKSTLNTPEFVVDIITRRLPFV